MNLPSDHTRKVKDRMNAYVKDQDALDLMDQLLILDPKERIDAGDSLYHDFFTSDPLPCDLSKMLSQHLQSMFQYLATPRSQAQIMRNYQQTYASQMQNNTCLDRVY